MCEFKINKKKKFKVEMAYIVKVGFFNISNPHLLPLANFFASNFSFLILPDILFNNTPIPFL